MVTSPVMRKFFLGTSHDWKWVDACMSFLNFVCLNASAGVCILSKFCFIYSLPWEAKSSVWVMSMSLSIASLNISRCLGSVCHPLPGCVHLVHPPKCSGTEEHRWLIRWQPLVVHSCAPITVCSMPWAVLWYSTESWFFSLTCACQNSLLKNLLFHTLRLLSAINELF